MILLIDNYDSFVHNLGRYLRRLGHQTHVVRNDAVTVDQIRQWQPHAIVLSPGPCTPREAGCSMAVVTELGRSIPILGVCLGHQAIAAALGGRIVRAPVPMHGRTSWVWHDEQGIFRQLPNPLQAARYHSLVVDPTDVPSQLKVTARTADGIVMAICHRQWPVIGVQFHPESILTEGGYRLLDNFLQDAGVGGGTVAVSADSEWVVSPVRQTQVPVGPIPF